MEKDVRDHRYKKQRGQAIKGGEVALSLIHVSLPTPCVRVKPETEVAYDGAAGSVVGGWVGGRRSREKKASGSGLRQGLKQREPFQVLPVLGTSGRVLKRQ